MKSYINNVVAFVATVAICFGLAPAANSAIIIDGLVIDSFAIDAGASGAQINVHSSEAWSDEEITALDFNANPAIEAVARFWTENVSNVLSVSEPAIWVMMIGGLGLAGAAMRRRPTEVQFS